MSLSANGVALYMFVISIVNEQESPGLPTAVNSTVAIVIGESAVVRPGLSICAPPIIT